MINFEDLRTEIDEVKDLFNSTEALMLDDVLKFLSECNLLDAIKMLKVLKSKLKDVSLLDFVENWIYVLDMTKNRGFLNEFGVFKSFDELVNKGLIELSDDSSSITCCDVELLGYLYLPDYIKVIKQNAFTQCLITEVILNDNLEEIEGRAFYDCTFLKRIVIPSKIKKIPFQCFYKCCSLSEVVINENCEECLDGAFYETKIKKIIFGKNMKHIGEKAFYNCLELEEVLFTDNNLTNIESEVFYNCKKLKKFDIMESVNIVGDKAFYGCYNCIINLFSVAGLISNDAFIDCKEVRKYISAEF